MRHYSWIGQAGYLIEIDNTKIVIDPYLSNSVEACDNAYKRMQPIDESFITIEPDVVICTHDHLDHTDPDTLKPMLNMEKKAHILAPRNSYKLISEFAPVQHNMVLFSPGTSVTLNSVLFKAVKAEHTDEHAVGIVIEHEGFRIYVTGDTLYNDAVIKSVPKDIDMMFVCINGVGDNMNIDDAVRFSKEINAKVTIPMHYGMFKPAHADPDIFIEKMNACNLVTQKHECYVKYSF